MSESLERLGKLGVKALGISPDPPDRQKRFDEKNSLGFPLLSDEDGAVARAYGAWGVKNMYGNKKEGIVRSSFLIDEAGKVIAAWYKVKPENTVSLAIEALGAAGREG